MGLSGGRDSSFGVHFMKRKLGPTSSLTLMIGLGYGLSSKKYF